jgi:YfiH family protein
MGTVFHESELLVSPGVVHGFFTRQGGVSKDIYAGLNCGPGSNDNKKDIRENRRRAAAALGFAVDHLCTLYQVHSNTVLTVNKPWVTAPLDADAMVSKTPGLLLGILTADCAPVLFSDAQAGVIGAAHAGWKGAMGGVLENTIDVMMSLGAKRETIAAAVGPCIGQQSYEVGAEFAANFFEKDETSRPFFIPGPREGHPLFHLEGYVVDRLKRAGLQHIEASAMDTAADAAQFFSYRRKTLRGERDYGRQLSAIGLKTETV